MPQIMREMAAFSTFKIMIQSLTLRFMMMKISLPQKCAAYMKGDAIIQKVHKILRGGTATIMNLNLNTVDIMTMILLSQQRHVVFVKTELKVMTMTVMIVQKMSAITMKTTMER